ncbi:hypothetical protein Psch_01711 [Pelotomaculum schinkii]|uniref:Uncharacterized protein n=1 Tax=Pelotomaculum schinkii TaxID=78350 RepID=A0A4Y7RH62_9FIRM|nr:hypothetical protein [Pelotomaculum schinkii]TEB08156.1 hypothetical protein Psch_01711 [Pelotomaculum schinkii]
MKNPGKTVRAAVLLLVLCMISTAMMGGTFAKYTSEYDGEDMALIANWTLTPTVIRGAGENTITYDLGDADLDLFSHTKNHMLREDGHPIIAPGVDGDFVLNIANTGDVAAEMTFDFAVNDVSVTDNEITIADVPPIEYSLTGNDDWCNLYDLKDRLKNAASAGEGFSPMSNVPQTNGKAKATVYWRWPYEASTTVYTDSTDVNDTTLGTNSAIDDRTEYKLTITVKATQINPNL